MLSSSLPKYILVCCCCAVPAMVVVAHNRPWKLKPVIYSRKQWGIRTPLSDSSVSSLLLAYSIRGGSDKRYDDYGGYDSGYGQGRYDSQSYYKNNEDNRYDYGNRYDYDSRYDRDNGQYGEREDPYEYDDRGRSPPSRYDRNPSPLSSVQSIVKNGDRRIGFGLLGSGMVITMLGISLFFNKALMRLGNLLFIAGVPMTIGPGRTAGYFFQPRKSRATACLALGIFLVFIGYPVLGILLEIFGLLNLFGNMFPVLFAIVKQMPIVGPLLNNNNNSNRRQTTPRRDRHYDSDPYYDRGDKYEDDDDDQGYDYGGRDDYGRNAERYY